MLKSLKILREYYKSSGNTTCQQIGQTRRNGHVSRKYSLRKLNLKNRPIWTHWSLQAK